MELTKKKDEWLTQRKIGYLVGDKINKNKQAEIYYRNAIKSTLNKFFTSLLKDIENDYKPIRIKTQNSIKTVFKDFYKIKKSILEKNIAIICKKSINYSFRGVKKSLQKILGNMQGKDLSINYDKALYDKIYNLVLERNINLITNIVNQDLTNIQNIVYNGVTTGQSYKQISTQLEQQKLATGYRAEFIARDQTAKSNQVFNEVLQKTAGIEYFEWLTSEDERVSTGKGGHKELNGKIYKWNEPENFPYITYSKKMGYQRGLPSERPNCRCTALPVFILDDYKPIKQTDGSYLIDKQKML